MTDRDVVERVGVLLERSIVPLPPRKLHYKPPYMTQIKGAPAVELMRVARPLLGEFRKPQIDHAIATWHGKPSRWRRPVATCSVAGCDRRGARRGLCKRHYNRWWKAKRYGRPTEITPVGPRSFASELSALDGTMTDDLAVAWLAGLLEGEGTFGLNRSSPDNAYPVISLQMCDETVVSRAAGLLSAPSVQKREPTRDHWNPTYAAAIVGHDAAIWMERLRPLMGRRRTEAIDAALAAYHPIRLIDAPLNCVVPGCDKPHEARGLCHKHYMSWSRDIAGGKAPRVIPLR